MSGAASADEGEWLTDVACSLLAKLVARSDRELTSSPSASPLSDVRSMLASTAMQSLLSELRQSRERLNSDAKAPIRLPVHAAVPTAAELRKQPSSYCSTVSSVWSAADFQQSAKHLPAKPAILVGRLQALDQDRLCFADATGTLPCITRKADPALLDRFATASMRVS
jgi:hypothetical protein